MKLSEIIEKLDALGETDACLNVRGELFSKKKEPETDGAHRFTKWYVTETEIKEISFTYMY